ISFVHGSPCVAHAWPSPSGDVASMSASSPPSDIEGAPPVPLLDTDALPLLAVDAAPPLPLLPACAPPPPAVPEPAPAPLVIVCPASPHAAARTVPAPIASMMRPPR